jgi:hypothetical protein
MSLIASLDIHSRYHLFTEAQPPFHIHFWFHGHVPHAYSVSAYRSSIPIPPFQSGDRDHLCRAFPWFRCLHGLPSSFRW